MRRALLIIAGVLAVSTAVIHAATAGRTMWASPNAVAVKRVSEAPDGQTRSDAFENIDCTEITYRLVDSSDMRKGCFTPTAFGMLDADHDIAIFNGTDEGLPLHTNVPHRVLAPWPKALNLVTLDAVDTGGSYINVYKNPLAGLEDERNWKGQLIAKRLTLPPDIRLTDATGKPLIVNPNAIAFSSGGGWMVAETLSGSFVRINLASLDRLAFAPAFAAAGWPGTLFSSQVAVSEDGRYVAIGNDMAGSLKIYDLSSCVGGICPAHDYLPFLKQKISGLRYVYHIRFINDGLLSLEATTSNGGSGVYELAPTNEITSLTDYLGLGDSYTSGEGAFDYLTGTDTPDNTCHLSAGSYPLLLSRDLFGMAGGHSVACSGAVINDIGSTDDSYRGQVKHGQSLNELRQLQADRLNTIMSNFSPGYVAQHRFAGQYQPRIMTVSIGGNDIGFGDILERCVVPHISRHHSDENCYNTYESRREVVDLVDRTVKRWTALYQQLKAESPGSTIYAIDYPSIASDIGKCAVNVRLDKNELEFSEELIHYMNASIRQAAEAANVPYVDIGQALAGHRLCEASGNGVAVNGLTAGNDSGILGLGLLGRESYHPNALGHQLIEQAILRQTNNLSSGKTDAEPVTPSAPPDTGNLLNAPKTGRLINELVRDQITAQRAQPGESIHLQVGGAGTGTRPDSVYKILMDGPTGASLARLDSDSEGDLSGIITIPPDADINPHTIDVIGPGQGDSQLDITQSIYITPFGSTSIPAAPDKNENISPASTSKAGRAGSDKKGSRRSALEAVRGGTSDTRVIGHVLGVMVPGRSSPGFSQDAGTFDAILVAVFCLVIAATISFGRRIIKSFFCYFGGHCNNWLKKNCEKICSCFTIVTMRTFGVIIFSVILFVSLLVFGLSTSSNSAITNQDRVDNWLGDSNLYGAFVENAINQAEQTAGTDQSGGVSLSDTVVKQAAEQSFSSAVLKKDVDAFLDSNYGWLSGKASKPEFRVDLSAAKKDFGIRVGKYVTTYLKGLPACSAAQQANINPQAIDPLTLQCLPQGLNPATVGAQVTQQITNSTQFLSNPVLTADNINPESSNSPMKPYYQRFSTLPSLYRAAVKIPWIAGIISLLSLAAIILTSTRKRKGLKAAALVFALAGLIMVSAKFLADQAFNNIEKHVFNSSTVGQLQKALTVFLHHVESQVVKVDLWFGIAYLLIALALLAALVITRQRGIRIPKRLQNLMPSDNDTSEEVPRPNTKDNQPDVSRPTPRPKRPKPPRLVQ